MGISPTTSEMTEHTKPESCLLRCSPQEELLPVIMAKGHYLVTQDGREIFDASGGAGVSCLGPGTPVAEALSEKLLAEPTGTFSKAVLLSSGSAVTEAAAKLITQYWKCKDQPERRIILSRNPSYHGSTYKAPSLSAYSARSELFENSLSHTRLSACDSYRGKKDEESDADYVARLTKELESEIESTGSGNIAGLILEPVAGAALGAMPYIPGYLQAMLDVCKKRNILSIFDECMSGMYRTGNLYAWMRDGAAPDVLTLGECLAGGYDRLSVILMSKEIANVIEKDGGYFNHDRTFQNWAPACAGALEFIKQIHEKELVKNISKQGEKLMRLLRASLEGHPNVGDIRGEGLMIGIEFVKVKASKEVFEPKDDVARKLRNKGLAALYNTQVYSSNCDGRNFLMLLPPYTITDEEVQNLVDTMKRLIYDFFEARELVASSAEGGMEDSTGPPGTIAEAARVDRRYIDYKWCQVVTHSNVNKFDKFAILVRKNFTWDHKFTGRVEFVINSKALTNMLRVVLADAKGSSIAVDSPVIPAETLFLHLPELEDYVTKVSLEETAVKHGVLLVETIKLQYKDIIRNRQSLIEAGKITFELLWTLLKPNGILLAPTEGFDGESRGYQISYVTQQCDRDSNLERYVVEARYIDFGTSGYVKRSIELQFDMFQGARDVKSLPAYPLEFSDSETRTALTDRGQRFFNLKLPEIWEYNDKALSRDGKNLEVHGRVVLDNVSYHAHTKQKDQSEDKGSKRGDREGQDQRKLGFQIFIPGTAITEDELLITNPVVAGYSFCLSRWAQFALAKLAPNQWEETFDDLVLNEEEKTPLRNLLKGHFGVSSQAAPDIIRGKSRGVGILLLGPPGTGKTLTAEGVAEHFERPLLSFTPATLSITTELSLREIFHLGHRWRAVLLLDEADPFIKKRSGISDDDRVANLLKEFESFRGVLFLTTNLITHNIDDALFNRMLQVIKYGKPTRQDRKQIWKLYIKRANLSITSISVDTLARYELVGREIQTVVLAATLRSNREPKKVNTDTLEYEVRKRLDFKSPPFGLYQ